jgi:L-2-hydroxyglutarate oxidase LhgO
VLEAEAQVGMHSSSRNSEVIHAGLYYPEESLKARLCTQGKKMLYAYCEEHHVSHKRLGKLILAPSKDEHDRLEEIREQAAKNGVSDLQYLSSDEVRDLEPEVVCGGGLWSPSTGIIDSHDLMTALQAEIEGQGGVVVLNGEVTNLNVVNQGIRFESGGKAFVCGTLVNSAGLWAHGLVEPLMSSGNRAHGALLQQHLAKGHYFAYQGKSPFRHLIYPLPFDDGLGIHATNDLSGAVRFGPDVTWVDSIDYEFDESRKPDFVEAIRIYFPGLHEDKLTPAYTGIRPKLVGPGGPFADFVIQTEKDHGVPGLINLYGIESPGLTACLAIGKYVKEILASTSS